MASNRLGYVALGAFSLFLYGCPVPVDMSPTGGMGGSSSSGGSGGRGGSGSGGSTGGSSGGSNASGGSGGSTGGSGTGGSTGGSSGGSSGGTGGSSGGTGGNRMDARADSTSGTGGSTGGTGGSTGGSGGASDGGGMEAPSAMGTKLPPAIAAIFLQRCPSCHMNQWRDATMAYQRLLGMGCNQPRMVKGMGAMSLVIRKMRGAVTGCGARMPLNMPVMPDAEIAMIETWINMGANPVP